MPSDYHLSLSLNTRTRSSSPRPRCIVLDDRCSHFTDSLSDRIQDHARLLAPKSSSTSIYIDHLPFGHDDHGYKAMVFSKDKSGDRKVLLEGEYKFSSCRNQAKRKAMEALLKKSGDKVKEEMEKHEALATGRWVFLSD